MSLLKHLGFQSTEGPMDKLLESIKPNPLTLEEENYSKGHENWIRKWKKSYIKKQKEDKLNDLQFGQQDEFAIGANGPDESNEPFMDTP
jgi:hypothetical protein